MGVWTAMRRLGLVIAALAMGPPAVTACDRPQATCERALVSYSSCVNAHDWDCLVALTTPADVERYQARRIRAAMAQLWHGVSGHHWTSMTLSVDPDRGACQVATLASWTERTPGKANREVKDDPDYFTLRAVEGAWYVDVPGAQVDQGY